MNQIKPDKLIIRVTCSLVYTLIHVHNDHEDIILKTDDAKLAHALFKELSGESYKNGKIEVELLHGTN